MIHRLLVSATWLALAAAALLQTAGCDSPEPPEHPAPAAAPATAPADALSDSERAKLAALRHLIADQPLAADREVYAAYQIRDTPEEAAVLAAALRSQVAPGGPPIVAVGGAETYRRKGRAMDRATGRAVKVFQARVIEPSGNEPDGAATRSGIRVRAWWRSGRLAGQAYRYQLRKTGSEWEVVGRSAESPGDGLGEGPDI